ncbi:MAG: ABC transporter ATP-binding protein [Bacteroidales bacterium]|nr:ABC transporter ATP-binding protein [Bacteroidales bacterium]
MKSKIKLFRKALDLVWQSAPGWATVNIIISVLQSFFPLVLIWLIKLLIDEITAAVTSGGTAERIIPLVIAVVVIYFLDEISSASAFYVRRNQSVRLEEYMYELLHAKAVRLDLINFEHPGYYDSLSRAVSEAPWRPNSILDNIISMFRGVISLILMAGILLSLHWGATVLLIVVNIPGIWLRLHYADIIYNFQKEQTPETRKTAYFNWLLTGDRPSREIRLFGLGDYFISLFKKSYNKQKAEELNILRKRTLIEAVTDLFKALSFLILLLIVARQTVSGVLTLGQMAMFILAFRQGMSYIKDVFNSVGSLYEDGLFIGDVFGFLGLKESVTAFPPVITPAGLKSGIVADRVSFTYPGNQKPSLENVSLEIKKGEIIALVGPNGAGKSTLVRLLTRLYDPGSGNIRLDGQDIRAMDPQEYRKYFSVVFQDFMLYNLSAGENIRLGNIESAKDLSSLRQAARSAGVDELLNNLPKGYDTVMGTLFDESRDLSWGEWQKIALARALFREAPVLILDEPSSSLDADTEYEIFRRFRDIVRGRTAILITHRLSNVTLADRIVVLENGSVAESGSHDELMKKQGRYYEMYTKQSSRFV